MPTSTDSFLTVKQKKYIFYILIGLLALIALGFIIGQIQDMVILFIASLLMSYILDPIITYLESNFKIKRLWAILLLYIVFALVIGVALLYLFPIFMEQFKTLNALMGSEEARNNFIQKAEATLHGVLPIDPETISEKSEEYISAGFSYIGKLLLSMLSVLSSLVIVPFILFFILKDGRKMKTLIISHVPNRYFEMSLNLVDKTDQQLGTYIRGQIFVALAIGILSLIVLWILGIPYYFFIGMLAGLANMIPYLGPIVGMIPAVGVSLFMFDSLSPMWEGGYSEIWQPPVFIVGAFLLVQLIDNISISPLIVSKSVDLHPLIVIVVVLVGGQIFGLIGMLVAVPVVSIVKVVTQEVIWHFKNYKLI